MRLINTETGKFEEFFNSNTIPLYAILSHTWEKPPGREQTYQDVVKIQEKFGLSSPSDGVPSNPLPKNPASSPQTEVLDASSETHMPIPSTVPQPPLPHLFPRMFACLGYLLLSILAPASLARAFLYLLLGYKPLRSIWDPDSGLCEKIRKACEVARKDGYGYIWVDSCCIDKTSSSELSEAINSMFNWYRDAQICYAFLADVPSDENVRAEDLHPVPLPEDASDEERKRAKRFKFRNSRWFKRAWTLQELIAPHTVVFLSEDWKGLGTKRSLADLIAEITHIDREILTYEKALADETVAKRMRWAAEREATRVEDRAYSLLGIFGITMTTLYGEGAYAFQRLQEEILQRIPDLSLFAWNTCIPIPGFPFGPTERLHLVSPFATSPLPFANIGDNIDRLSKEDFESLQVPPVEEYTFTPHGIRTTICFIPITTLPPSLSTEFEPSILSHHGVDATWYFMLLGSKKATDGRHDLVGKLCAITHTNFDVNIKLLRIPHLVDPSRSKVPWIGPNEIPRDTAISQGEMDTGMQCLVEIISIYIPRPAPPTDIRQAIVGDSYRIPQSTRVSLSPWAWSALPSGYTISKLDPALRPTAPTEDHCLQCDNAPCLSLRLSGKNSVNLIINYRYMRINSIYGHERGRFAEAIEARIWILSESPTTTSPPYTSAIWTVNIWQSSLLPRDVGVMTESGDEVTLRLWLGIAKFGYYHAHFEVMTDGTHPAYPLSTRRNTLIGVEDLPGITKPHTNLELILLGSVRRELKARGYNVHLEQTTSGTAGNSFSHTLTMSNVDSGLKVIINYFYILSALHNSRRQQLVVAARVTLESSSHHGSEMYQDGPYVWRFFSMCEPDGYPWRWSLKHRDIYITAPTGDLLRLTLGLDLAWVSEYYLVVGIEHSKGPYSQTRPGDGSFQHLTTRLFDTQDHTISLKLPARIRRVLQAQGYEVHFQGPVNGLSDPYHLTLSDSHLTIGIQYTYNMSTGTGSDVQQGLTFRACVTTSFSQSSQNAASTTEPSGQIVEWDAWQPQTPGEDRGWHWILSRKDVKVKLPDDRELTVCLRLYLLWLSEYCISVKIIPPTPLPRTPSTEVLLPCLSFKKRLTNFSGLLTPARIRNRWTHWRGRVGDEVAHSGVAALVADEEESDVTTSIQGD